MKKRILLLMLVLVLSGCCKAAEQTITTESTTTEVSLETTKTLAETSDADFVLSSDKLLDLFLAGEMPANYTEEGRNPFYITELTMDEEDFFSYKIGERIDLDNDGEKEQIIDGAYGGIYLDARDGAVYVLAQGDGTAVMLSYVNFDKKTWIVYSDTTHAGRVMYDFTLFDGTGQAVDQFGLYKEFWEYPNEPDGPNTVYTYRDKKITREEYDELIDKIFTVSNKEKNYANIVTDYVAPSSVGDDLYKFNVLFEGNMYSLPCPVSELLENGFVMENAPEYIESGKFYAVKFKKGSRSFDVEIVNYADVETIPENCFVCTLRTLSDGGASFDMVIPCNIKVGDSEESLMSKLKNFYYEYPEEGSKWLYVNENSMVYSFGILVDSGVVKAITASNPIFKDMYTGKIELVDTKADNSFFYAESGEYTYNAKFAECEGVNEAGISVKTYTEFDDGILYQLEIICDKQVQDVYGDMLKLGYFLVTEDTIYKIDSFAVTNLTISDLDELIKHGTIVCHNAELSDALSENEKGWHEYIEVNGNKREYHGYSNTGETNFYENFTWEEGKGLIYYRSGFGAESYGIELTLAE